MHNKKRIILTDCDGVLADWNSAFVNFMNSKGYIQHPNTDAEYNLTNRFGISAKQSMELIKEFNEGPLIASLEAFADSVEFVGKLAIRGFKFIVVTSISNHPDSHIFRTQNLTNLFGDVFDSVHCIEQGASKASILATWADTGYFWIEDHMRQAEAGHEVGLKTILINHPYNSHYKTDLFPTVSFEHPWEDIYNIVCKEYNI